MVEGMSDLSTILQHKQDPISSSLHIISILLIVIFIALLDIWRRLITTTPDDVSHQLSKSIIHMLFTAPTRLYTIYHFTTIVQQQQ